MEFFSLVGRVRRGLPVYVCARLDTVGHRVGDAIEQGATGRLTDEGAKSLAARCRVDEGVEAGCTLPRSAPTLDEDSNQKQMDVGGVASEESELGPVPTEDRGAGGAKTDEPISGDDESEPNLARVPWLRYAEVPGRKAPGSKREPPKREPPGGAPSGFGDAGVRRDVHEPLLTDEELAALLDGDGLSHLPDEQGPDDADGEGDSGATR
jgi:hypothetical protein